MKKHIPDALLIVGACLVSFGVWLAYPPAGFVIGGAMMIYAGLKAAQA